jgi:hypothetical protein
MVGRMMRGPFEWQMIDRDCDLVNGEVLKIPERIIKVTLALRWWVITLVLIQAKTLNWLSVLPSSLNWVVIKLLKSISKER